jgi:hypothetical protein
LVDLSPSLASPPTRNIFSILAMDIFLPSDVLIPSLPASTFSGHLQFSQPVHPAQGYVMPIDEGGEYPRLCAEQDERGRALRLVSTSPPLLSSLSPPPRFPPPTDGAPGFLAVWAELFEEEIQSGDTQQEVVEAVDESILPNPA